MGAGHVVAIGEGSGTGTVNSSSSSTSPSRPGLGGGGQHLMAGFSSPQEEDADTDPFVFGKSGEAAQTFSDSPNFSSIAVGGVSAGGRDKTWNDSDEFEISRNTNRPSPHQGISVALQKLKAQGTMILRTGLARMKNVSTPTRIPKTSGHNMSSSNALPAASSEIAAGTGNPMKGKTRNSLMRILRNKEVRKIFLAIMLVVVVLLMLLSWTDPLESPETDALLLEPAAAVELDEHIREEEGIIASSTTTAPTISSTTGRSVTFLSWWTVALLSLTAFTIWSLAALAVLPSFSATSTAASTSTTSSTSTPRILVSEGEVDVQLFLSVGPL